MDNDDSFLVERTICQLPSCHVFAIPTLKNAAGHRYVQGTSQIQMHI
jgi:hypothetical protein